MTPTSQDHRVLADADGAAYQSLLQRPVARAERYALGKALRKKVPLAIRRNINETFYQRFFLDEQGVQVSELNPPFDDFHAALTMSKKTPVIAVARSRTTTTKQGPLTGALDRAQHRHFYSGLAPALADILSGAGSSKNSLVELRVSEFAT